MSQYEATVKFDIPTQIYGYTIPKKLSANTNTLPLFIPTLLPKHTFSDAYSSYITNKTCSLNTSCFGNAPDCKPIVQRTISIRSYLMIPKYAHNAFSNAWFRQNSEVIVVSRNNTVDGLRVTNSTDNSVDHL